MTHESLQEEYQDDDEDHDENADEQLLLKLSTLSNSDKGYNSVEVKRN